MPKLSVNLVAYNGEKYISPCLSSVLAQNFRDFSVLMIDNGSSDGTRCEMEKWAEIFKKEGIEAKVIFLDENVGFAEGHNLGFKFQISRQISGQANFTPSHTTGQEFQNSDQILNFKKNPPVSPFGKGGNIEYVCCLNQDVILAPDYLANILKFMDAHTDCGSASGKLLRVGDETYTKLRETEHETTRKISLPPFEKGGTMIIDSAGLKIFKSQRVIELGRGETDSGQYDMVAEVFGVSGTAPVYRIEALEDVKIILNFSPKADPPLADKVKSQKWEDEKIPLPPFTKGGTYEYFDKDFFSYKEDIDLAYRLRWRGWKSFVVPEAVAYHKRGAQQVVSGSGDIAAAFNRKNKSASVNYLSQRNHIWTLVKNMDTVNFAAFWYELKKFGYELFFEWSTFKAWFDAFKKMRVMREKRQWIMESKKVKAEDINKWFQ